jgi:predicted enzyme related to lactoylglutathione lyase
MLTCATPIFAVADLAASMAYYRDALGFDICFDYGAPPYYSGLQRDGVELHLIAAAQTKRLPGHGAIYVFAEDADALHDELRGRGAKIVAPPVNSAYGMRDFNVTDLDGNQITFGREIE